jgi:hypothetical protein
MSQPKKQSFTCPHCQRKQDFNVWETINVTEEPKLKTQVLKRELGKFTCENCAGTIWVKHPIQYHDIAAKLMFWLAEGEAPKPPLEEGSSVMGLMASTGYTFRRVNSFNELVEKIRCFDDRQDDRAVEALKVAVRAERKLPPDQVLLYSGVTTKEGNKKVVRLTGLAKKSKISYEIPAEELVRQGNLMSRTAAPEDEARKWLHVDEKFAAERLKTSATKTAA